VPAGGWCARKELWSSIGSRLSHCAPTSVPRFRGVDLTKLDDTTFDQIHKAFLRHQVLFFRDQELTREQHLSFGRRFGELHIHPAAPSPEGYPAIMRIHSDAASTANLDQLKAGKRAVAGNFWHSAKPSPPQSPSAIISPTIRRIGLCARPNTEDNGRA
jgi:hypothetical protein